MVVSTGLMMNSVMNSASPAMTWLGGTVCTPSALRVSESTMITRVKLVSMMSSAGATLSSVRKMMMVRLSLGLLKVLPRLTEICEPGSVAVGAFGADGADGAAGPGSAAGVVVGVGAGAPGSSV